MCFLKAVENGATILDTCNSSFGEGASHSSTESMVAALAGTEYDTGLDLPLLQEITAYFREVRKKYWQFESEFTGVDTRVLVNQVPGGMISNLSNQLKEQGALNRMDEVLAEIPRVREDLGFPPLVTPTSQIVGTQAVLNVLTGERYKTVTNEVKLYLQGRYGKAPGKVNDTGAQHGHRQRGSHHLPPGRPAGRRNGQAARRNREPGQERGGRADLRHVPGNRPQLPAGARRRHAQAGTTAADRQPMLACGRASPPNEFNVTLHGETYHIHITGTGRPGEEQRPFFVSVDGVPEEVLVETLNEVEVTVAGGVAAAARKSRASKRAKRWRQAPAPQPQGHVTTAMPGTIVDVLVKTGQKVKAGDAVLVIEAMKMENEVQAPIAGTVINVCVAKGDSVTPDEALVEIQPE